MKLFYDGYGKAKVNIVPFAYSRYERVVEDLVAICEQILVTDEGNTDREQAYIRFKSNFEPGQTIEIADNTYMLMDR